MSEPADPRDQVTSAGEPSPPEPGPLVLREPIEPALVPIAPAVIEEQRRARFAKAYAAAQAEFQPVTRNREVRVPTKSGGEYTFRYAELSVVLAAVMPALTKHGFSLRQEVADDKSHILTTLEHEHGVRTSKYPIFVFEVTSQNFGGATTYARRYGLTLLLGIASEDDEDGNRENGAAWTDRPTRPPPPRGEDRTQRRQRDAFPLPARTGPDPAPAKAAAPAPSGEPRIVEPPSDPDEFAKAEGVIADAMQELHEAAVEGRAHGIRQIWDEIARDPYVVMEVWGRLKLNHPDSFATVKSIVMPKDSKPRGPKK